LSSEGISLRNARDDEFIEILGGLGVLARGNTERWKEKNGFSQRRRDRKDCMGGNPWRSWRLGESKTEALEREKWTLAKAQRTQRMDENEIGKEVVDAAIVVHRELGPGLMETVYEVILLDELRKRGLRAERQVPVDIKCRGVRFDEGFRADIIVEEKVILELKSVEKITNAHKKQLLTYLKLTGKRLGYLLNFGEAMMKHGITRTVNGLPE